MADGDLSDKQVQFLEKFCAINILFYRQRSIDKREAVSKDFKTFNTQATIVGKVVDGLDNKAIVPLLKTRLKEAERVLTGTDGKTDLPGALVILDQVKGVAENAKLESECRAEMGKLAPRVTRAMEASPEKRADIGSRWEVIQERVDKGAKSNSKPELTASLQLMSKLDTLLEELGQEGSVAGRKMALVTNMHEQVQTQFNEIDSRCGSAFPGGLPPALGNARTAAENAVELKKDDTADEIAVKTKSAQTLIAAFSKLADQVLAEQTAWDAARIAATAALTTIKAHKQKDATPHVAPEIVKLDQIFNGAVVKANAFDFTGALADAQGLPDACRDLTKVADDVAKVAAVRAVRTTLVNGLTLPAGTDDIPSGVFPAVEKSVTDVKNLLAKANLAADEGRLADAVASYDKIPEAAEKARIMIRHQAQYDRQYAAMKNDCNIVAAKSGEVGKAIKGNVDICKQKLREALREGENDIDKAVQALGGLWTLINAIYARIKDIETWIIEKADFDTRLKAVEDRKDENGRVAIEDYYQRLLADKSRAEALVAAGAAVREWAMATRIVTATKAMQADKIALAVVAKDYLANKKAIEDRIKEVKKKTTELPAAAQALATAEKFLANAVAQTVAKDWNGAVVTLATCKTQMDLVEATIGAAAKVTEAKNDPALAAVGTDFEAAYQVYLKAKQAAQTQDSSNMFAKLIQGADAKAQEARTTPAKASALLGEAIEACNAVIKGAGDKAAYDVFFNSVRSAVNSELPPRNQEDVIKQEIADAKGKLTESLQHVAPPQKLDFGSGLTALTEAQTIIVKARRKADAYDTMKKDRKAIDDALVAIDKEPYRTVMTTEVNRLKTLKQDIKDKLGVGETATAIAKAKEGGALGPALTAMAKDYDDAKARITDTLDAWVTWLGGRGTAQQRTTYIQGELDTLAAEKIACNNLLTAKAFKAITAKVDAAHWVGEAAKKAIVDGPLYEAVAKASKTELDKLTARRPIKYPYVTDLVDRMAGRYAAAEEQARLRNYTGAKKRLDTFVADCVPIEGILVKFDAYRTAREAGGKALGELARINDQEAIEPLVTRLTGQQEKGRVLGDDGQFDKAKVEFDAVVQGVAEAKQAAQEHQAFLTLAETVKTGPATNADDLRKQIAEGRKLVADQKGQPASLFVRREIFGATEALDAADKLADTDLVAAGAEIGKAMKLCADARLSMGLYTQMAAAEAKAQQDITTFLGKPEAGFVRDPLTKLQERLENTISSVRADPTPARRDEVQKEIEAVLAEFLKLQLAAERQVKHVTLHSEIAAKLPEMERHEQRYAMKDDIVAIRQMLVKADGLAEKHDHAEAMDRLKQAQEAQDAALLKADMTGDKVPNPADLKKILERDGGPQQLDEIIKSLDDVAKKKVLKAAFEARYGCKLESKKLKPFVATDLNPWKALNPVPPNTATPEVKKKYADDLAAETERLKKIYVDVPEDGSKGPNIQRFYNVMTVLPDSDTLDNDSMIEFEATEGPATGSFYGEDSRKRVTMREGEFGDSGIYGVGLKHELEDVDPDSTPVPSEAITYFSWNTLHEVGHAVDDKLGFMKTRGNTLAGWIEYGGNTYPIAQAVAGEFNFDATYISAYMSGTAEPPIPEPDGCEPEEWERRRVLCCAWVDRVREPKNPWSTTGSAAAGVIGDRAYQESYTNSWTSYPFAARKKGVSGYQFRAPGEWFSELYAAFHTGKLNPSHPARDWLEQL